MLWEDTPRRLAVLHAGDSLVKRPIVALIVGVWQ